MVLEQRHHLLLQQGLAQQIFLWLQLLDLQQAQLLGQQLNQLVH
jgi:hypothetical protein